MQLELVVRRNPAASSFGTLYAAVNVFMTAAWRHDVSAGKMEPESPEARRPNHITGNHSSHDVRKDFQVLRLTPLEATGIRLHSERGYSSGLVTGLTRLAREGAYTTPRLAEFRKRAGEVHELRIANPGASSLLKVMADAITREFRALRLFSDLNQIRFDSDVVPRRPGTPKLIEKLDCRPIRGGQRVAASGPGRVI
ncbi:hypothetical protein B0H10DRAFT_2184739 [Mycena sp. CBHHK59/15]|nr:hypothetical protein B0H10DRAFT_2184739 [Mycena sp. CBHHK59/15]